MGNQLVAVSETPVAAPCVERTDEMRLVPREPNDSLQEHTAAHEQAFPRRDELDALATMMIPDTVAKGATKLVEAQAEKIFRQGIRGCTARAMLSRDIATSRAHLALFTAMLAAEVQSVGRGKSDVKKARLYADLVGQQHRRLTTSCELMLRLDLPPVPSVRVTADRAFLFNDSAPERQDFR